MSWILEKIDAQALVTRLIGFLPDLVAAVLIMLAFYVLYRMTRSSMAGLLRRAGYHEALIGMMVSGIYRGVLIVFGLIMALDQVGINVGAALAGLGVAGVAVGLAAQDSLSNSIAGFMIFWDKPFAVGDWVDVAGKDGRVVEITMRTTRIRTRNNTYVIIPNKTIIDEVLDNHTKHGEVRVDVPVGIAYKEHIPTARDVMLAAVRSLPAVQAKPEPEAVVTQLGSSSVDLEVRVWIEDAALERPIYFQTMEACKLALDEAGIEIPYHHLQLFIEDVQDRVWDRLAQVRGPESGAGAGNAERPQAS